MTKKRLKQLEALMQGQDFASMQSHFMTHFGEAPELLEQSRPASEDNRAFLQASLAGAVAYITGGDHQIQDVLVLELSKLGLIYGQFRWQSILGGFFFCEAIGVGLVYLPNHSGRPGFSRFRVRTLERPPLIRMMSPWQAYALSGS